MISIKVQVVMAAAEKYMKDHLSQGEFVSEGEERSSQAIGDNAENLTKYYSDMPMRWHGSLVTRLGFDPVKSITENEFKSLLKNINPNTGKNLTARTVQGRRLYFDATTSAPKSVSILAVTMGDYRLIKSHEEATAYAIKEIEKMAQTRVRVNNQDTVRKTGSVLCSSVTHTTSRANDPQLHSHNLFFNVTWDQVEQKYKALEAHQIYDKANYFTEIYRHVLAKKVRELGYEIEHQKHGWEIKGITPEICAKFSKRSQSIKQKTADLESQLGRTATNKEIALVTEKTRKAKSKNLTIQDAIELQKGELSREQLQNLEKVLSRAKVIEKINGDSLVKTAKNPSNINTQFETKNDIDAFNFAIKHVFERNSVVSKQDLMSAAIKFSYGKFNLDITDKLIDTNKGLFRADDDKIGTIKGLSHELYISGFVDQNKGKFSAKKIRSDFNIDTLNPEQKNAFKNILKSQNQVYYLDGSAGTGKSFLLSNVCAVIKENQVSLLATAPTAAATQNLEKDMKIPAQTLQNVLFKSEEFKAQLTNGYLIVDEAGFISSAQMDSLFKIADKYNTQILLVGDTKQHHGVEAGDALRALKLYSSIETSQLNTIIRQKNVSYKNAVLDLQNQKYKNAWAKFKEMGVIKSVDDLLKNKAEITDKDLHQKLDYKQITDSYLTRRAEGKSVLLVTPTRHEVNTLTAHIRASQNLNRDEVLNREVLSSARFTEAEKNNIHAYIAQSHDPHYVIFHKKVDSFKKNSLWKVVDKDNYHVILKNEKTSEVMKLNPGLHKTSDFDVLNKKSIEILKGDDVILQKNNKSFGVTNGEVVRVKDFKDNEILLEDGRIIKSDYSFFDYGYVSTSHSSQGKTCDHAILAMTNAGGKAISAQQFYVSASRGRESIEIYVESEEFIQSRIESFGNRTLNRELIENSNSKMLNELKAKTLDDLAKALQTVNFDKSPETKHSNTTKIAEKKSWVVRNRESFYKTADKFMSRIMSFRSREKHIKPEIPTPTKAKHFDIEI